MKNISDIANLAGVSKSTVSAFKWWLSKPQTKEKLSRIIEEHDYHQISLLKV